MRKIKQQGMIVLAFAMLLLVFLMPGALVKIQDGKTMGKIHTGNVSPSRDALLTSLTLEERIELFCSSEVDPMALYVWDFGNSMSDSEGIEQASVKYFYKIEEAEAFAALETELEKLVIDEVLPELVLVDWENGYTSGMRFYLYSEEKNQGAVFLYFERYNKAGALSRYIVDEESGKIISAHLNRENIKKDIGGIAGYGKKFLTYMNWHFTAVVDKDMEQYFQIQGKDFFYYICLEDHDMVMYPSK